jgi:transposase
VAERVALVNQMRGLLMEFAVVVPKGIRELRGGWKSIVELHSERLPTAAVQEFDLLYERLVELDARVTEYDRRLEQLAAHDELCRRLMRIEGVGPITASAVVATVGDAKVFNNGRQFAAWLGLTPRQYSTGGKPRLGRISKRRRSLPANLVGARSALDVDTDAQEERSQESLGREPQAHQALEQGRRGLGR